MKTIFSLFLVFILSVPTFGQQMEINSITPYQIDPDWYEFPEDSNVSFEYVVTNLKSLLNLSSNDSLSLEEYGEDTLYHSFVTYQQYNHGYKVEGAIIVLNYTFNTLLTINGRWFSNLNFSGTNFIAESLSVVNALNYMNAEVFNYEDSTWEAGIKIDLEDTTATYYPSGELVFARDTSLTMADSNFQLCYRVNIYSIVPLANKAIYINAYTGNVTNELDLTHSCNGNSSGTVQTLYDGTKNFNTTYRGFPNSNYHLKECRGGNEGIHTKFAVYNLLGNYKEWNPTPELTDGDNSWSSPLEQAATTAHWAGQKSWDYFLSLGRNGSDNEGRGLRIWVNWNTIDLTNNAKYVLFRKERSHKRIDNIYLSEFNHFTLATLDIMGHEYSHGVVQAMVNFMGPEENRAVKEGIADIFGTLVEKSVRASGHDWLLGADIPGKSIRNIANPSLSNNPDTYKGLNWDFNVKGPDFGHKNSTVISHWFYLLSEGGTQNGTTVIGIGTESAIKLIYFALGSHYLYHSSNFWNMRRATLKASSVLFGECSFITNQCILAWTAVGVANAVPNNTPCAKIYGPKTVCTSSGYWYYTDFQPGATYSWSIPSGWQSTIINRFAYIVPNGGSSQSIAVTVNYNSQTLIASKAINQVSCSNENIPKDYIFSNAQPDIQIFPNPTKNHLSIHFVNVENLFDGAEISVRDILGKEVFKTKSIYREITIENLNQPAGLYFVKCKVGNYTKMIKLVIQ